MSNTSQQTSESTLRKLSDEVSLKTLESTSRVTRLPTDSINNVHSSPPQIRSKSVLLHAPPINGAEGIRISRIPTGVPDVGEEHTLNDGMVYGVSMEKVPDQGIFDPLLRPVTLIVGDNGTGKTTYLDTIKDRVAGVREIPFKGAESGNSYIGVIKKAVLATPHKGVVIWDDAHSYWALPVRNALFKWLVTHAVEMKQLQILIATHSLEIVDSVVEASSPCNVVLMEIKKDADGSFYPLVTAGESLYYLRHHLSRDVRYDGHPKVPVVCAIGDDMVAFNAEEARVLELLQDFAVDSVESLFPDEYLPPQPVTVTKSKLIELYVGVRDCQELSLLGDSTESELFNKMNVDITAFQRVYHTLMTTKGNFWSWSHDRY